MAIWQYKCALVPNTLGNASRATRELMDVENWDFDGLQLDDTLKGKLSTILPPTKSWHEELFIWGQDAGDRIDVWIEDGLVTSISCRFDTHAPSREFVAAVCRLAQHLNCNLVYLRYLDVLHADPAIVFEAIVNSVNRKVLEDPQNILPKLAAEIKQQKKSANP